MVRRAGSIVAVVLVLVATMNLVSLRAGADPRASNPLGGEVPQAACNSLNASRTYGVASNGSATSAGASGSARVQEYDAPQSTKLSAITLPDGFNAAKADDATLAAFHLPPRPTDADALAEWLDSYGHAIHQTPPSSAPCLTDLYGASANSPNWGGRLATSSGFKDVTGYWTQPNFVAYCQHASNRAIWDGIGGWGSGYYKLIQAGSITTDISGSNINAISPWVEVYDLEAIITVSSPALRTGDSIKVETVYSTASGGTATWWFTNRTTGASQGWTQSGVSAYYDGAHAEYVDERATNGSTGNPYLLRKSTNYTYWSGEYINGKQSNSWPTTNVTMKDTAVLMTAVMGATVTSSETWKDCGPGSGTNQ
jgi:hypothetical protein